MPCTSSLKYLLRLSTVHSRPARVCKQISCRRARGIRVRAIYTYRLTAKTTRPERQSQRQTCPRPETVDRRYSGFTPHASEGARRISRNSESREFWRLPCICRDFVTCATLLCQLASCLIYAWHFRHNPTMRNCRSFECVLLSNQIYLTARNPYCGTWYLPHSQIHN